ncbi:hypothetical protein OIU85_025002 [Salix viminalis]|uniref:Uncharacterized protein n=1 Tax=Salix viminalis TaxID=40686 RepID=A0A9Q0U244_SALVM|nr:hypothetical protein OIU85_025002 [Salix viminalis]
MMNLARKDEVQTTPTGGVGGVSGNGIGNMQGSASPDGALTTGSDAKKKNKRKRKSKDVTDDLAGKEKEASVCQSGENESLQKRVLRIKGVKLRRDNRGVTISESCTVSVKEKHTDPVQEGGRPSSQGVDMSDTDTTNEKNRHVPPELATASAAKKRSSKNTILDDSQKHASDQVDGLEEERKALHPGSMPHEKCEPSDTRFKESRS